MQQNMDLGSVLFRRIESLKNELWRAAHEGGACDKGRQRTIEVVQEKLQATRADLRTFKASRKGRCDVGD
jgi:hypothetical protein